MCQLDANDQLHDPNLIVGFDKSDDAGVYKISPELALVQTVDFFTPVVDDPYLYGQIAAANSLSDVYAMGGKPLTVLNIACFSCSLEPAVLADILKGGAQKIKEAGAILVGGHTVTDKEMKYGLSVTGTVHPERVVTNSGAKPGDVLVLTKLIGTGIITTAFKFDVIGEEDLKEAALSMSTLNKAASEAMLKVGVHACTDITGFGLLGHSYEMADGSGVELKIDSAKVPLMSKVMELIRNDAVPGGAYANMQYFSPWIEFEDSVSQPEKMALFDPQTSGGLLISVSGEKVQELIREMQANSVVCAEIIGEVVSKGTQKNVITVV